MTKSSEILLEDLQRVGERADNFLEGWDQLKKEYRELGAEAVLEDAKNSKFQVVVGIHLTEMLECVLRTQTLQSIAIVQMLSILETALEIDSENSSGNGNKGKTK
jgi:hypothetical protein